MAKNNGKIPFDQYEAAILLDGYYRIKRNGEKNSDVVASVSTALRNMAMNRGETIPDSYRSVSGITGRMRHLSDYINGTGAGSEMFAYIVGLTPSEYELVLEEAKNRAEPSGADQGTPPVRTKDAVKEKDKKAKSKKKAVEKTRYVRTATDQKLKDKHSPGFKQVYHALKNAKGPLTATDIFNVLDKTIQRKVITEILEDASWSREVRDAHFMFYDKEAERRQAKLLEEQMQKAEKEFYAWLPSAIAPAALEDVKGAYRTVSAMLVQKKVLSQPLIATTQIGQVETALRQVKTVFSSKKLRNNATKLLTAYLTYLREKKNTKPVENKENTIDIGADWIHYDGTNSQAFEQTFPAYCSVGNQVFHGKNWARILVAAVENEFNRDTPALLDLYKKPLLPNRRNLPFFMDKRIEGQNCAQLTNGYWINLNQNIPRLIELIHSFCLHCGYAKQDIVIYGAPKASPSKSTEKTTASIPQTNEKQPDMEQPQDIYTLKTTSASYSGRSPAEALLHFCEQLARKYPLGIRRLLDTPYCGTGAAILSRNDSTGNMLMMGDPVAYVDQGITDHEAILYGQWLCTKLNESDYPRELTVEHITPTVPEEIALPDSETQMVLPMEDDNEPSWMEKELEKIVLEADLDGITYDDVYAKMNTTMVNIKSIAGSAEKIIALDGRLYHEEAFVDWEDGADQLEAILTKLILKNNGYVSAAQLYEYARSDMQMFLNDNDLNSSKQIYDMAQHLFEKVGYHGKHYTFQGKNHISPCGAGAVTTNLDVMLKYARDQGGFFLEDDLVKYLQSIGIKTGNLRSQMRVYTEPIFLFYERKTFITAESMKINSDWFAAARDALKVLFDDMGDHVVLREIHSAWFEKLPQLPGGKEWTPLLLQSVLSHYSKQLGGTHTIPAMFGQSNDTLHTMLVSQESEVQSFGDVVVAFIVDEEIQQRRFEAEELRKMLVERGILAGSELIMNMPKALEKDSRFAWDAAEENVLVKI